MKETCWTHQPSTELSNFVIGLAAGAYILVHRLPVMLMEMSMGKKDVCSFGECCKFKL